MRWYIALPAVRFSGSAAHFPRRLVCGAGVAVAATALAVAVAAAAVGSLRTADPGADVVLERDAWIGLEPLGLETVLARLAGVTIARRGGLGSPDYLNVAGSLVGRVQVRVDGIDATQPEFAWPDLFAIPLQAIERIALHRSTDPVLLEIWTRRPETGVPITEIDLGRGDLVTRTRRVGFWTPPRSWWVGVLYDELLRGLDDFRPDREAPPPDNLGSSNGRSRAVEVGFRRPSGETLRLRYADFTANANGSYADVSDFTHTGLQQNSLRYERGFGALEGVLDLTYQEWDRSRRVDGAREDVTESRAQLGLDLDLPHGERHRAGLRIRAADVRGARAGGDAPLRAAAQAVDVELHGTHSGRLQASWWLGGHGHEGLASGWSARAHLLWPHGAWELHAQGGRGFAYAGWGEARAADDPGTRPGALVAGGVRRSGKTMALELSGYFKDLTHQSTSTAFFFPLLGSGPRRIAGALGEAELRVSAAHLDGTLAAQLAWTPWTAGDRGGTPDVQAELRGRVARAELFQGDLDVSLQTTWRLETRRRFTSEVVLASVAYGDVLLNFRLLRALNVFWRFDNVTDARLETHPGVLLPGRRSLFGVRVTLEN